MLALGKAVGMTGPRSGFAPRHSSFLIMIMAGLMASGCLSACASKPHYSINDSPVDKAAAKHHDDDQAPRTMRSSTDTDNNWGDAFTAPLTDLNLKRQAIPDILKRAITKPYDLTGLDSCPAISAEVSELDVLLGADFDEPPPPDDSSSMSEKSQRMANHAAVGAVRNAARSIIPFRGLMRQVTGADKHQKEMDTAIQAGKVRRAYLKGVGMNKNCAPPAAPSWFKPHTAIRIDTDNAAAQTPPPVEAPPQQRRLRRKNR